MLNACAPERNEGLGGMKLSRSALCMFLNRSFISLIVLLTLTDARTQMKTKERRFVRGLSPVRPLHWRTPSKLMRQMHRLLLMMAAKILRIAPRSLKSGEGRALQTQKRGQNPRTEVSTTTMFGV